MPCADTKLLFISTVAVFLLHSVTAQGNAGPAKFEKRSNAGVFGFPWMSRSPRGIRSVFRGGFRGRYPSVSPVVHFRSGGGPSPMRLRYARRSLDPGIEENQITKSVMSHSSTFIEPMLLEGSGAHYSGDSLDTHESLGPMIGPLSFAGFGKNLYVRLIVPPDEEDADHVTLHLIEKPSLTPFANFHKDRYVERKPWPGKAAPEAKKLIFHRPVSFAEKPIDHTIGAKPFTVPEMNWSPMHQVPMPFIGQPEYRAAPNHHQLPIVNRPANNLIDLPIYPPLSSARPGDVQTGVSHGAVRASGNEAVVSNGGQTDANVFARIMHQATVPSKFGPFPSLSYSRDPPRVGGGIASPNSGSGHVLTTGGRHFIDEMGRNVAGTNADHFPDDEISATERPRESSTGVNDPPLDIRSGKHAAGNSNENIH